MEHLAILSKSSRLLQKIISREKTIESRWYSSRRAPFGRIRAGETIYFKESGKPVSARAEAEAVLEFSALDRQKISEILAKYGRGIGFSRDRIPSALKELAGKKYCVLVFLKNARRIPQFEISKRGFGNMSAWICVESVNKIKA